MQLDIINKALQSVQQQLNGQRQKILKLSNEYFDRLLVSLQQTLMPQQLYLQIQQKQEKIRKGSIKALIQYYTQTYTPFRQPKLNVSYSAHTYLNFLKTSIHFQQNSYPNFNQQQPNYNINNTQTNPLNRDINLIKQPNPIYKQSNPIRQAHKTSYQNYQHQVIPITKNTNHQTKQVQFSTPLSHQKLAFISPIQKLGLQENDQIKQESDLLTNQKYQIKFQGFRQNLRINQNKQPRRENIQNPISLRNLHQQNKFQQRKQNKPQTAILNQKPFFNGGEKGNWRKVVQINNQNLFKNAEQVYKQNNNNQRPATSLNKKILTPDQIKALITKPQMERVKNRSVDNKIANMQKPQEIIQPVKRVLIKQQQYGSKHIWNQNVGINNQDRRYSFEHGNLGQDGRSKVLIKNNENLNRRQNMNREITVGYESKEVQRMKEINNREEGRNFSPYKISQNIYNKNNLLGKDRKVEIVNENKGDRLNSYDLNRQRTEQYKSRYEQYRQRNVQNNNVGRQDYRNKVEQYNGYAFKYTDYLNQNKI